eukprot:8494051-Heterocapsa_arctica.AAC.1
MGSSSTSLPARRCGSDRAQQPLLSSSPPSRRAVEQRRRAAVPARGGWSDASGRFGRGRGEFVAVLR